MGHLVPLSPLTTFQDWRSGGAARREAAAFTLGSISGFPSSWRGARTCAAPQKELATAMRFLVKELNRFEDDDIEDVMLRDGVIHFVKPPSS